MKLLLRIAYVGTRYGGYQVQPNADTVQARLNLAAERLFGYPCDIVGCSRTDSGVHAREFCAAVTGRGSGSLETDIPAARLPLAFSANLPEDICVYDACFVPSDFHPRYGVVMKEYIYRILNRAVRDPFEADRAYHLPRPIPEAALEQMNLAAEHLCGTHDFRAFMAQGSKIADTVRTVYASEVTREGDILLYRVRADGFLYNMVRILAGTLVEVGEGKRTAGEIPDILRSLDRSRAGRTLPACGLYLNRVFYPENPFGKEGNG